MEQLKARIAKTPRRLQMQLFCAYLLLLVLFCGVFFAVMLVVRGILADQIGASRFDVLRQISDRVSVIKTSGTTLANLYEYELRSYGVVQNAPHKEQVDSITAALDAQKSKYDNVFRHIGLNSNIVFMAENGFYYSTGSSVDYEMLRQSLWYSALLQNLHTASNDEVRFSRTYYSSFNTAQSTYLFAVGRLLRDREGRESVLLVQIEESLLQSIYAPSIAQGGEIYIYDQNGMIVSHSNKKMLGKQFIDVNNMQRLYGLNTSATIQKLDKSYLLTTYHDEQTGWTIVEEVPTTSIFGAMDRMNRIFASLAAAGALAILVVATYMSRRISRPLAELSAAMDSFGSRDFTPLATQIGTWEIDHLRESFNNMAGEIFNLMDAVQQREQQKRLLEMNFLRAQINPHFLYNMLFSIRCTVEIGKNKQAAEMINAFTDLLKSTLVMQQTAIPLQDELESTRKYLVVQKLRYGEKVHFEFDIDPDTTNCFVPPLILQPLVENAIFHGLEAKPNADMIVISAAKDESDLVLTVADDGAGMDAQALTEVRRKCIENSYQQSNSIGVANVHHRIRLNYGDAYGVTIDSVPQIGTTVILRLPAVEEKGKPPHEGFNCG